MKLLAVLALLMLGSQCLADSLKDTDYYWTRYKNLHGKTYKGEEDQLRKTIFEEKLKNIVKHNLEYDLGQHSYRLGLNKYSDLSLKEVSKYLKGLAPSSNQKGNLYVPSEDMEIPSSLDWRSKGYVTEVKDQGKCGSCWAFSAVGSLEGQHYRKSGKLVSLSEQNLMDCGGYGCDIGSVDESFEYVVKNHGIDTEESYPYKAKGEKCAFNRTTIGATCKGYMDIVKDEKHLQQALAEVGPISVSIDAYRKSFHDYSSGVYDEPRCTTHLLDHAVLVVGYGTENGKDYWLVKNSWGTTWGEQGYIKMSRNKNNQCGIATSASFPIV